MKRFALVGVVAAAFAGGAAGIASAADEIVTARLVIESVPEIDSGYAVARSIDLTGILKEAKSDDVALAPDLGEVAAPADLLGEDVTGTVGPGTPVIVEEKVASAAAAATAVAVIPAARPDFESSKSLTPEITPPKRKVVKVSNRIEKRRVMIPMGPMIGAFR